MEIFGKKRRQLDDFIESYDLWNKEIPQKVSQPVYKTKDSSDGLNCVQTKTLWNNKRTNIPQPLFVRL